MDDALKILIVDDSVIYRKILSTIVFRIDNVELLGTAPNGKIALSKIKASEPDLVLLDVSMPVMDGIETLKRIRREHPDVYVIMVSGMDRENANITVKALSLGALDFIPKPEGASYEESLTTLQKSLEPIVSVVRTRKYLQQTRRVSISGEKIVTPAGITPPKKSIVSEKEIREKPLPEPATKRKIGRIDVVAVGVSTGGPNALQSIIPNIEEKIPVPILTVQHMPPNFTASLAERLNKSSKITVTEGKDGEEIQKGQMYIAPGGRHMVIRRSETENHTIGIIDSPPVNSCRPAVDVLFRSVGMVYGGNVLTVILTGMGYDGASGVSTIRRKGGYSIVQDEDTSVVWGMPGTIVEARTADEIIPLNNIAKRITEIVYKGAF